MNASVNATLNYSVDNGRPIDYYFYEPSPTLTLNPPGTDPREVVIEDAWPRVGEVTIDREGFALAPFVSTFDGFDDDAVVRAHFYPEVVAFVRRNTGARRVEVFDHTIRRRMPADLKVQTDIQRPAVTLVHSDYTPKSGPQRVRDLFPDEADDLLSRRVAFINVWKPLYDVVEELPLGILDAGTQSDDDLIVMELKYTDRTGEIYVMRHSPKHRWYYFPRMRPDQALLLKTYDSETDGRARFMGHSAFEDPTTPPNARPRQSIELRTMAFF